MTRPLTQIVDAETGETLVREMTESEYLKWQEQISSAAPPKQTKEDLLAELQALTAKITALADSGS